MPHFLDFFDALHEMHIHLDHNKPSSQKIVMVANAKTETLTGLAVMLWQVEQLVVPLASLQDPKHLRKGRENVNSSTTNFSHNYLSYGTHPFC